MTDEMPWYRRWWAVIAALVLGILGGIFAVVSKTTFTKKKLKEAQTSDNRVLEERLKDQTELGKVRLRLVDTKAEAEKAKAEAEHKEKTDALADKAKADAAKNAANPDDAARSLGSALERAAHKLNNGPGSKVQ